MKRITIYVLLSSLLLLQSCLKERKSACESWLLLRFSYTLNNQYTNLFGSEVHKVTVYVFDELGKYVGNFSEQGSQLTNDYVMRIPLPEGKYSVVAYGGGLTAFQTGELNKDYTLNNTLRVGETELSDFRIELMSQSGEDAYLYPSAVPDDLYSGFVRQAVAMVGNGEITDVELIKDTKQVIVRVRGAVPTTGQFADAAVIPYDVHIKALNGRYVADNNIDLNHGTLKYVPVNTTVGTDFMEANLKIMRLVFGLDSRLVVINNLTSEVIYNQNMLDQILQNPKYKTQQDIDREDLFVFEIGIGSQDNQLLVTVSINGWKINSIIPDK